MIIKKKDCSFDWCMRVCNHVIAVYSENKLQHYATAYRNHKSAGEKLGLFRFCKFLAHLSRRLTRWAYSIPMVRRPSVVRRRPSSSSVVVHTFKLEYLWGQLANLDQILCVALLGWGKGCIRFWGRLDQNSGFHSNKKPPLTYNGENDVSTFSRLFLIRSFLYLQVTRTCIKSRMSSNFGQFGRLTTELAALSV